MKQRENIKTFSPSIYKPFYCPNKLQVVFLHQDIRAPVRLAASHQNTELQSFSKKGTADESGSLFLPISSKKKSFRRSSGHRLRDAYVFANLAQAAFKRSV